MQSPLLAAQKSKESGPGPVEKLLGNALKSQSGCRGIATAAAVVSELSVRKCYMHEAELLQLLAQLKRAEEYIMRCQFQMESAGPNKQLELLYNLTSTLLASPGVTTQVMSCLAQEVERKDCFAGGLSREQMQSLAMTLEDMRERKLDPKVGLTLKEISVAYLYPVNNESILASSPVEEVQRAIVDMLDAELPKFGGWGNPITGFFFGSLRKGLGQGKLGMFEKRASHWQLYDPDLTFLGWTTIGNFFGILIRRGALDEVNCSEEPSCAKAFKVLGTRVFPSCIVELHNLIMQLENKAKLVAEMRSKILAAAVALAITAGQLGAKYLSSWLFDNYSDSSE
mmetsp:Transcript_40961/g.73655  ORF Transcript_40961/g.73655 Transcript_40961/m.73655 type:complete len:340 (-) Transcript_40961:66-1085(-)